MSDLLVSVNFCPAMWGPEAHGPSGWRVGHYCGKDSNHEGRHVCLLCKSWKPADYLDRLEEA